MNPDQQISTGDTTYFAAREANATANVLLNKAKSFYNALEANFYLDKLRNMWQFYHGCYGINGAFTGHEVSFTGEQGELVALPINHFRNISQHMLTMVAANRPIMEARAVNTDYKSLAQTYLANGILDYYMREKGLEECLKNALEQAIVLGAGFIKMEWNATAGEPADGDPDTGGIEYEGEIEFSNLSALDVVVDGTKESWNNEWVLTRSFMNRFNLMAKYPEFADKIRAAESKSNNSIARLALFSNDDTDDIPVYEFYHKRTDAMPDGRYMLFVADDCVLIDAALPYRVIPIFRIAPANFIGTPYGYSPMFDIFPIQEMINSTVSAIATNQTAFAVQNIFVPRGSDLSVSTLEGGLNIVEGNAEPKPLQLTQTPAEVFKFLELLVQSAELISGVNSVTRGQPEASLESGTALALVQSMSLQFISGLQHSYVKLVEQVGTALIQILKDYATYPKVVAIVGKNNRPLLKEFTGEDLNAINRVIVDLGNPLSRTTAGRVQMAEQLLQMKVLKSPEQYFQVLNTGRLDVTFEGEMSELLLIKSENEKILEGLTPLVSPLDQHRLHIVEHKAVLSDPDLRENPDLVRVALDHIEEHVNALRTTDPAILQLIGEQPLAPPMPPMVQPPVAGGPGPGADPGKGNAAVMQSQDAAPDAGEQIKGGATPQGAAMPPMPTPPPPFENNPINPADMMPPQ